MFMHDRDSKVLFVGDKVRVSTKSGEWEEGVMTDIDFHEKFSYLVAVVDCSGKELRVKTGDICLVSHEDVGAEPLPKERPIERVMKDRNGRTVRVGDRIGFYSERNGKSEYKTGQVGSIEASRSGELVARIYRFEGEYTLRGQDISRIGGKR